MHKFCAKYDFPENSYDGDFSVKVQVKSTEKLSEA